MNIIHWMMNMKNSLKTYTQSQQLIDIDVKQILTEKGIEFTDRGHWIHLKCLFPDHDDSNPSMSINVINLGFNCFGCSRDGTWSELCNELGWKIESSDESVLVGVVPKQLWKESKERFDESDKSIPEKVFQIPDGYKLVKEGSKHYQYIEKRNIVESISSFKIGMTNVVSDPVYKNWYKGRIIIPVHNSSGKYIWCEARTIYKNNKTRYYRPAGVEKQNYLFNLHRVLRSKFQWVIVVEGIIDAMNLWMWELPAVCTFGASLSIKQLELLTNFEEIYLCYDNDKAGNHAFFGDEGKIGIKDLVGGIGISIYRIIMPRRKDVNDIGKKYFLKLLDRAKKIV